MTKQNRKLKIQNLNVTPYYLNIEYNIEYIQYRIFESYRLYYLNIIYMNIQCRICKYCKHYKKDLPSVAGQANQCFQKVYFLFNKTQLYILSHIHT